MPPIQHQDGSLAVNNEEKQKKFCKELLTPPANIGQENIEVLNLQEKTKNSLVDWYAFTMHEIEAAIFQASNTSAGLDNIPPLVIKKVWPMYKKEVICLFQRCLKKGYHPNVFKNAILCILPKPTKRPRLLLWSYYLIALLSYFGKVLK